MKSKEDSDDNMNSVPVNQLETILKKWKEIIDTPLDPLDLTPEAQYKAGFQRGLQKAYENIVEAAEWE